MKPTDIHSDYIGTGEHAVCDEPYTTIDYPFGIYEVRVRVSEVGKFLGIEEVKANKSFMRFKQQISQDGYLDVDEYYKEEIED